GLGMGEDALLGWKIAREGRARFVDDAVVRHEVVRPPVQELFRRAWMAGGFPALVREIPELRGTLLTRHMFLGTRRIPMYAFIAAALLRWRLPALAALAWWAGARAREARRLERSPAPLMKGVAVEMATDVVTGTALAAASVRA